MDHTCTLYKIQTVQNVKGRYVRKGKFLLHPFPTATCLSSKFPFLSQKSISILLFHTIVKTRQQTPNGVTYAKPHVTIMRQLQCQPLPEMES